MVRISGMHTQTPARKVYSKFVVRVFITSMAYIFREIYFGVCIADRQFQWDRNNCPQRKSTPFALGIDKHHAIRWMWWRPIPLSRLILRHNGSWLTDSNRYFRSSGHKYTSTTHQK